MGLIRAHRLSICVGLLAALLLVPPAFACEDGEVPDEQEIPECCSPEFIVEGEDGKVCEMPPSDMSVAVAVTLILSFTFLISLQCFMNHRDMDMREYAYTMISSTVSIFSAVLMFQSFSGLLEDLVIEPLQKTTGMGKMLALVAHLIHMLLWYVATQLTIATVSCALKSEDWRKEEVAAHADPAHHGGHTNVMLDIEINCVCYGIVLAHLTGFASIKFWTLMQQIEPFNQSPVMTLALLPLSIVTQLCLEWLTDTIRECYINLHGKDWFEKTWDQKCQHAEDDIMGLTLSVIIVNSLRYAINNSYGHGCLPNSEQKEEGEQCEFDHSGSDAWCLFGCGLLFVVLLFFTKLIFNKMSAEEEQSSEEDKSSKRRSLLLLGECDDEEPEKSYYDEFIERIEDVVLTTWGMAHSWCVFHGTRQLLMATNPSFLGKEANATALAVVLASGVTYIALLLVRIMDFITSFKDWLPHDVDDAIKTVIGATSIFIGFAWEQTFDYSVDNIAERTRGSGVPHAPAIAKLVIGSGCIGVVFFSWKWYILPFVFKKGWRYGYIFTRHDLHERCHELAEDDAQFSYAHLHGIAHSLAEKSSEHKDRFATTSVNLRDHGYEALPATEVEALHEEIQELRIHAKYLEEQLAEQRRAEEEWKIHRRFLEQQVVDERLARSNIKTRCQRCGEEFLQEGQLVDEAKVREYLLQFLEWYLEEDRKVQACCSRVGEEASPTRSSTYGQPSPRREKKDQGEFKKRYDMAGTELSTGRLAVPPTHAVARFMNPESTSSSPRSSGSSPEVSRSYNLDLRKAQRGEPSVPELGAGRLAVSFAHSVEEAAAGQALTSELTSPSSDRSSESPRLTSSEKRNLQGDFSKRSSPSTGFPASPVQKRNLLYAGRVAVSPVRLVEEDSAGFSVGSAPASSRSAGSVKFGFAEERSVQGLFEKRHEALGQEFGVGRYTVSPTTHSIEERTAGHFFTSEPKSTGSAESAKPGLAHGYFKKQVEAPGQEVDVGRFAVSPRARRVESTTGQLMTPESTSARLAESAKPSLAHGYFKKPYEAPGKECRAGRFLVSPRRARDGAAGRFMASESKSTGPAQSAETSLSEERKGLQESGDERLVALSNSPPLETISEDCGKIHKGLEKILVDLEKLG